MDYKITLVSLDSSLFIFLSKILSTLLEEIATAKLTPTSLMK